ncbi:MAG: hypothetical protein LLG14_19640 [Nocardiaceae bacterium]|nr:hypothetical protein [Nocardiaceae bacterium]
MDTNLTAAERLTKLRHLLVFLEEQLAAGPSEPARVASAYKSTLNEIVALEGGADLERGMCAACTDEALLLDNVLRGGDWLGSDGDLSPRAAGLIARLELWKRALDRNRERKVRLRAQGLV